MTYDTIIIGGGPAGLSAALILGRCLRNVVVIDNGKHRNLSSKMLHAFLTRDNIPPGEFLQIAKDDLKKYETVQILCDEVISAKKIPGAFIVTLRGGAVLQATTLLVATGVMDQVPEIEGILELYGKSVYNCPYCDAWEERGKKIGVYGKGTRGFDLAVSLRKWSSDVLLCTDGSELAEDELKRLRELNICVRTEKVVRLDGNEGQLRKIVFETGESEERETLFFNAPSHIRSKILEQLDCPFTNEEGVYTYKYERTEVPGLFVAGNILREVQLVIVAAGQGAEAAFGINKYLNQITLHTHPSSASSYGDRTHPH